MGFLDRFRSKKASEEKKAEPAEPLPEYEVVLNVPSYFKAGTGEYHIFVDGEEHVCKPFARLPLKLTAGTHTFRAFSTPETLADVTEEIEISGNRDISITVNVKTRTLEINSNDNLRSHKEFQEKFKRENGIKKE